MARLARVVVPGLPHHVTARGNRGEPIFFENGDQGVYARMLAAETHRARVAVWAYCLMPNHVHLVLVPSDPEGLARAMGETHRRYTRFINARAGWSGHLFQSRYASVAMDESHLWAAIRYVSLNPVRAGLAVRAQDWVWSSVRAHLSGRGDGLVDVRPVLDRMTDFAEVIGNSQARPSDAPVARAMRACERSGRPWGPPAFVDDLERRLGRPLARRAAEGRGQVKRA